MKKTYISVIIGLLIGGSFIYWLPISRPVDVKLADYISDLDTNTQQGVASIISKINDVLDETFPLQLQEIDGKIYLNLPKSTPALNQFLDYLAEIDEQTIPNKEDISRLRQDISSEIDSLSMLDRQRISYKIADVDWSLNALDFLSQNNINEDLFVELVFGQSLVESPFFTTHTNLSDLLLTRHQENVVTAKKQIKDVNSEIQGLDLESLRSALMLAEYMVDKSLLNNENELVQLELRIIVASWLQESESLDQNAFSSENEYELAEYLLAEKGLSIIESAISSRVKLAPNFSSKVEELNRSIARRKLEKTEANNTEYQVWALKRIKLANEFIAKKGAEKISNWLKEEKDSSDFVSFELLQLVNSDEAPLFKKAFLNAAYSGVEAPHKLEEIHLDAVIKELDILTGWKDLGKITQALTADVLSTILTPINEASLDRPVALLYNEAFQKAWTYLEGTDYRSTVAEKSIYIDKKLPGDNLPNLGFK